MKAKKKKFWESQSFRIYALAIAVVIAVIAIIARWQLERSANASSARFVLGSDYSGPEKINIPLIEPVNLNGLGVSIILKSRIEQVAKYAALLTAEYFPTEAMFSKLDENGPWISISRLYYYGKKNPGKGNFYKESVASRILLNPYLLIKAEFWGLSIWGKENLKWNKQQFPIDNLSTNKIPMYPMEKSLEYMPATAKAQVTYDLSEFINLVNPVLVKPITIEQATFACQMQNARDLGFRFAYLDIANSSNIKIEPASEEVIEISDSFAYMPTAWSEQSYYNHVAIDLPKYEWIEVKAVPANAAIKLWYSKPEGANQAADFTFSFIIN